MFSLLHQHDQGLDCGKNIQSPGAPIICTRVCLLTIGIAHPEGMVRAFTHEEPSSFGTLESEINPS